MRIWDALKEVITNGSTAVFDGTRLKKHLYVGKAFGKTAVFTEIWYKKGKGHMNTMGMMVGGEELNGEWEVEKNESD